MFLARKSNYIFVIFFFFLHRSHGRNIHLRSLDFQRILPPLIKRQSLQRAIDLMHLIIFLPALTNTLLKYTHEYRNGLVIAASAIYPTLDRINNI